MLLARAGEEEQGFELLGGAEAVRAQIGSPRPPTLEVELEGHFAAARASDRRRGRGRRDRARAGLVVRRGRRRRARGRRRHRGSRAAAGRLTGARWRVARTTWRAVGDPTAAIGDMTYAQPRHKVPYSPATGACQRRTCPSHGLRGSPGSRSWRMIRARHPRTRVQFRYSAYALIRPAYSPPPRLALRGDPASSPSSLITTTPVALARSHRRGVWTAADRTRASSTSSTTARRRPRPARLQPATSGTPAARPGRGRSRRPRRATGAIPVRLRVERPACLVPGHGEPPAVRHRRRPARLRRTTSTTRARRTAATASRRTASRRPARTRSRSP